MIQIKQYLLGPMKNFIYLIYDPSTHDAIFIDPAWEPDFLITELNRLSLNLTAILLTHGHFDHVEHIPEILSIHNVPVYLSEEEAPALTPAFVTHKTTDNQIISCGSLSFTCSHTPGHTPGGQCFYNEHHLFTGDTLFIDGCGRCDGKTGNVEHLYSSLELIKTYPDNTIIYPGHHYSNLKTDTLLAQKQTNRFLTSKTKKEFIRKRTLTTSL